MESSSLSDTYCLSPLTATAGQADRTGANGVRSMGEGSAGSITAVLCVHGRRSTRQARPGPHTPNALVLLRESSLLAGCGCCGRLAPASAPAAAAAPMGRSSRMSSLATCCCSAVRCCASPALPANWRSSPCPSSSPAAPEVPAAEPAREPCRAIDGCSPLLWLAGDAGLLLVSAAVPPAAAADVVGAGLCSPPPSLRRLPASDARRPSSAAGEEASPASAAARLPPAAAGACNSATAAAVRA